MAMSHLFLSSSRPSITLRLHSPLLPLTQENKYCKVNEAKVTCRSINMESEHSGESKRFSFDSLLRKTKHVWERSPQPVKEFPWNRAFENFVQLVLDLTISVVKFLFVPVLAVSSISEMSYCAHERRLVLVPFPLVVGVVVAGVMQELALKMSPRLKVVVSRCVDFGILSWHLLAMMMLFTLIKLPGPYYPYWGRLFVPHFANGVLFRSLWSMFFWYKKTRNASTTPLQNHSSETN